MAEIEFLLPTVKYGNVKVRATPDELGISGVSDATGLGVAAAVYLNAFRQGFERGAEIDVDIDQPDVSVRTVQQIMSDEDVDTEAEAVAILQRELGATVVEESDSEPNTSSAPWNSTVDSKPKPWETGKAAPKAATKVAEINW